MNNFIIFLISAFLLGILISSASAQSVAATMVEKKCSKCHNLNRINKASKDAVAWEKTVDRMIKKGSLISPEEKDSIIKYLSALNN